MTPTLNDKMLAKNKKVVEKVFHSKNSLAKESSHTQSPEMTSPTQSLTRERTRLGGQVKLVKAVTASSEQPEGGLLVAEGLALELSFPPEFVGILPGITDTSSKEHMEETRNVQSVVREGGQPQTLYKTMATEVTTRSTNFSKHPKSSTSPTASTTSQLPLTTFRPATMGSDIRVHLAEGLAQHTTNTSMNVPNKVVTPMATDMRLNRAEGVVQQSDVVDVFEGMAETVPGDTGLLIPEDFTQQPLNADMSIFDGMTETMPGNTGLLIPEDIAQQSMNDFDGIRETVPSDIGLLIPEENAQQSMKSDMNIFDEMTESLPSEIGLLIPDYIEQQSMKSDMNAFERMRESVPSEIGVVTPENIAHHSMDADMNAFERMRESVPSDIVLIPEDIARHSMDDGITERKLSDIGLTIAESLEQQYMNADMSFPERVEERSQRTKGAPKMGIRFLG